MSTEIPGGQASDQYPVTAHSGHVKKSTVVDGQWGPWSNFAACTSECILKPSALAVGVMISHRKCDNPAPVNNGKYCEGSDKRVKLCDSTQVSIFRARVRQ